MDLLFKKVLVAIILNVGANISFVIYVVGNGMDTSFIVIVPTQIYNKIKVYIASILNLDAVDSNTVVTHVEIHSLKFLNYPLDFFSIWYF